MKNTVLSILVIIVLFSCKNKTKASFKDIEEEASEIVDKTIDSIMDEDIEVKKSIKQLKLELTEKGFQVFEKINEESQDTILMQQYFMAFLKTGPIHGQNEEEVNTLQKEHLAHLTKMYDLGYADISGPFGDDGVIRGITIYNVPTLKMADRLAKSDPMVKAGRLEIEIHPWWAAKGMPLR